MHTRSALLIVAAFAGLAHLGAGGTSRALAQRERGEPGRSRDQAGVRGVVVSATATKLTIRTGRAGDEQTFELTEKTKVVIDGKPGKAAELAKGVAVTVQPAG